MAERLEKSFPEIPGYRIESILGRGSMARVYRGRQLGIDRPVAIKVLRDEVVENEKILKRLMREARIAARFNHPHIVRALDAGLHQGCCYFVMELVEGRSIREIVEREGPFPEARVVELGVQIAEALNELHRAHVVHRDVKPANVIVDHEGRALLADLGLAKIEFDSSMTSQHRTVGTPAYMAPEQARNPDKVDSRCDLFSLGATLFAMASGRSPFEGDSVSAVITKILYEEAPTLAAVGVAVSPEFEQIVARLLEKDPARRYRTPSVLLRDLRALQRGAALPVGAAAPPRRRLLPAFLGLGGLVVAAALVLALWPSGAAEDGTRSTAAPESSRDAPAPSASPPRMDETKLEALIDETLRGIGRDLDARLAAGDIVGARAALEGDYRERFERALEAPFAELPRVAALRFENARLELERKIEAEEARLRDEELAALKRLLDGEIAAIERSPVYLDREQIQARLAAIATPTLDRIDQAGLDLARRQAAERLLSDWRRDLDLELERARRDLEDSRLDQALQRLTALEARDPLRLGRSALDAIAGLRQRIGAARGELGRRIENALALVDLLPPLGSPELARRDFELVLERLEPVLAGLPAAADDEDARVLARVAEVLREVAAWPERLAAALREERIAGDRPVVARGGERREVAEIAAVAAAGLSFAPAPGRPEEIAFAAITAACYLDLLGGSGTPAGEGAAAFLDYCDGDLLAAELRLERLAPEDPLRAFLGARLETAWVGLARVRSPEDKAAFRAFAATMAAYRAGDFPQAAAAAEPLRQDEGLKKSDWYREKRADIRRVLAELDRRLAVLRALGSAAARSEILSLDPPVVRASWNFADEADAAAFRLGAGHEIGEGALRRVRPAAGPVAPDRIEGLALDLPLDPGKGPVVLAFELRTSARPGEEPRVLIVGICGHQVGILSRLRQSRPFRHLELHGAERLIDDYLELGRVAAWTGPMSAYRAAFVTASNPKKVVLEPGRLYRFELTLDPADHSLALRIDGEEILRRRLEQTGGDGRGIEIRAPMPFAIESLRLQAVLAL